MSAPTRGRRWPLHVTLIAGLALCVLGFLVELRRGIEGHLPAWVYVLEWPFFAAFGVVIWWRLLRGMQDGDQVEADQPRPTLQAASSANDPELAAWQDYVKRFEAGRRDEDAQ